MKKVNLILLTIAALALSTENVFAYSSGSPDPVNGEAEIQTRVVKKSETAGFSDAISKGDVLVYDSINNNDGYTVTRVGGNNVASANRIACVASKAIATGNIGLFRCVVKGWVNYLNFDATVSGNPIIIGMKLCSNAAGAAVPCGACDNLSPVTGVNNCRYGSATANSPITAMEANDGGSGASLNALINAR